MRFFITILTLIVSVIAWGNESIVVTILHTTDVHGHLTYSENLADIYNQYRTPNTILIDCGDTIQGSFSSRQDYGKDIIDTLNKLNYDIWVIGNHDSDFGGEILQERIVQFKGASLAANWTLYNTPLPAWKMFEFEGIKIAVIGLGRGDQLLRDLFAKEFLTVTNELDIIEELVQQTKQAGADIVILGWHGGMYDRTANGSDFFATAPDIDLMLGGHTHQTIAGSQIRTGFFAQGGKHAEGLGVVQLTITNKRVQQATGFIVPLPPAEFEDTTPIIVELPNNIESSKSDKRPLPYVSWAAQALKEQTNADIGIYYTSSSSCTIPKSITEYELFKLFPYEDRVVSFSVSYDELITILEELIAKRRQNIFHELAISGIEVSCSARELKILEIIPKQSNYKIALSSFLTSSGNGRFPKIGELYHAGENKESGINIRHLMSSYLATQTDFKSEIWLKEIKK